jgi:tagatose-1,6-bisphosphate aldolase
VITEASADPTTVGRRRRLARLAGSTGIVAGIALDHRDSFRVTLAARGVGPLADDRLRDLKRVLVEALAPGATAVMIDAELGGPALDAGVIPASVGVIMPLEAQGYEAAGDDRVTTLLADFSPADALRWGADACKLLAPYRADRPTADQQDAVIRAAIASCHALGVPLVLEPVVHRLSTESTPDFDRAYTGLVVAAVERIEALGPDLLKLPFPVLHLGATGEDLAAAGCSQLAAACRSTPWVLLGAGIDDAVFVEQIRLAGKAGASGFLVGRGIWGPALSADAVAVARAAAGSARAAFRRCREAAERFARPLPAASAA